MATYTYQCEAAGVAGFLAQLVRYVAAGHYFYITGAIPERKDPKRVDEKLLAVYDIAKPKWRRTRRRRAGIAGIHYLRHRRLFVLIATHGKHPFFADHASGLKDIRRTALRFRGYSVRYTFSPTENRWKVFIRLDKETYRDLRAYLFQLATRGEFRPRGRLEEEFLGLPLVPYEPVRRQLLTILKAVNRKRRYAGLPKLAPSCIPKNRRLACVFAEDGRPDAEAA